MAAGNDKADVGSEAAPQAIAGADQTGADKAGASKPFRVRDARQRDGNVGQALRSVYQKTVNEDIPDEMLKLLGKLT